MSKAQLAARLAICQIAGTVSSIAIGIAAFHAFAPAKLVSIAGPSLTGSAILICGGLLIGIPFYCVALLILHNATASILRRPFVWCIGIPGFLFAAALVAFPPNQWEGLFWLALIPMAALIAGVIFYAWLWRSPILMAGNFD